MELELKTTVTYEELLKLVLQLPEEQLQQLKKDIDKHIWDLKAERQRSPEFLELLLSGPVMSDEQYEEYLNARKVAKAWTIDEEESV